jgi:Holliday junction resolvase
MNSTIQINKSTRHSKITGDFAEGLILYWLSKHGFECARVDHTGMDLIARNPHTRELMGISVKSRSRNVGTESTTVSMDRGNLEKLSAACEAFGCKPYFAVVVDAGASIRCFIVTLPYLTALGAARKHLHWDMRKKNLDRYKADPQVIMFEFESKTTRWWNR